MSTKSRFVVHRANGLLCALIAVFLTVVSTPASPNEAEASLLRAQTALEAKDYETGVRELTKAAVGGSPVAMFRLATIRESGEGGTTANMNEAVSWFERAANAGSIPAMKRLANMYLDGVGVKKSFETAAALYRQAGLAGDSNSLFLLAQLYWTGAGGSREPEKAVTLLHEAAKLGNPHAMNALGIAYRLGDGIAKDDALAYAYFKVASERGDRAAPDNLAQLSQKLSEADRKRGDQVAAKLLGDVTLAK